MPYEKCLDEIVKAAGGEKPSKEELDAIYDELEARIRERRANNPDEANEEAVMRALDDINQQMDINKKIIKRNAYLNLKARMNALDMIRSGFKGIEDLGVESLLVGTNLRRPGARNSAAAEQLALMRKYARMAVTDLETKRPSRELIKIFESGTMDRQIANAMEDLGKGLPLRDTVPAQAKEIAEILMKVQDFVRNDANEAGAYIKKIWGYVVRQSHDQARIGKATEKEWIDFILPKLDPITFARWDGTPEEFLSGVYKNLSTGTHLKFDYGGRPENAFKGPRNLAKSASAERVLHFNNSDDWFDYHEQFGVGSLSSAFMHGIEWHAQNTGLMRVMGTNPEANLKYIIDTLKAETSGKAHDKLDSYMYKAFMDQLDGSSRSYTASGRKLARGSSVVRALNRMSKLGASLFSQPTDTVFAAFEGRAQGDSALREWGNAVSGLFKGMGDKERMDLLAEVDVYSDTLRMELIANRYSIAQDDMNATVTGWQALFFRLNGMHWWTESQRRAAIMSMAHRFARNKDTEFGALNDKFRTMLQNFGIQEPEWNIIRQSAVRKADGRDFLTPVGVEELPNSVYDAALRSQGIVPTERRIKNYRNEVADKVRKYLADRMSFSVIEPDARVRAYMQQGTRRGTPVGELLRFFGELKSFPISVLMKSVGRDIPSLFGGRKTLSDVGETNVGVVGYMAQMVVATTLLGYLSLSLKDMLKGREPRPLTFKSLSAAFVQGGGAGIYADFLFGEANRYGGGIVTTAAGPTAGMIKDLVDLTVGRGMESLGEGEMDPKWGSAAFKFLLNNTPYANLFYLRTTLDYLILYELQEVLDPGSLRRMERRIERERNQEFFMRPSEIAAR
jgi:hypothetical protein